MSDMRPTATYSSFDCTTDAKTAILKVYLNEKFEAITSGRKHRNGAENTQNRGDWK